MDARKLIRSVNKIMKPVVNRVMLMVARGVVKAVNDAGGLQILQGALLADELRDTIERVQNYGLSSHVHPGAEMAVVFLGGNRDHGLAVAVDDRRYRPHLKEGEVQMYASFGQYAYMREDGALVITAPGGILLNTPDDKAIKFQGGQVLTHAKDYVLTDVHGYAEKLHWVGGTSWETETWIDGSTVTAIPDHGIDPPEVPSEKPDKDAA